MGETVPKSMADLPPLPERVRLVVCVFTYTHLVHADVLRWVSSLPAVLGGHPRVADVAVRVSEGYPTDRCRNAQLKAAADDGYHYCLMIDDDMKPDCHRGDPGAVPFLPSALEFAIAQPGPVLVGAPYTGGPPAQEVMVMRYRQRFADLPDAMGLALDKIPREEAATRTGFEEVAALPTGGLLIDTRVTRFMAPPWFYYEYQDEPFRTHLASTEDITFTRDAQTLGVKVYAAWDSWFGHHKRYLCTKPRLSPVQCVSRQLWAAYQHGWQPDFGPG